MSPKPQISSNPRTPRILVVVAAVFGLAALAVGAAYGAKSVFGSEQTTHTVVADPVQRVVVEGSAGDVEFTAGGRSDVTVTRTTSWLFGKPTTRQYVRDRVLYLESHCRHFLCDTDYTVRVPAGVAIEVDENAAEIRVAGRPGDLTLDTNAGDVRVDLKSAPGRIDVDTNAGDVHVTVPRGSYAVRTSTNAGDESVHGLVRYDLAARVIRASTNAGDVTIDAR